MGRRSLTLLLAMLLLPQSLLAQGEWEITAESEAALEIGLQWLAENQGVVLGAPETEGGAPGWLTLPLLFNVALAALLAVAVAGMGWRKVLDALDVSARMAIQIIAVCAAAGIIVGVIALTGVGTRFSNVLLSLAEASQLIALMFSR